MGSDREQELARTATAGATASDAPAEPVGATLGRYRLERELGAGAMGVVHAAFDPDLERRIALKVLRGATATAQARDRLLREARAMARLSHPNVVTVHEVGTAGGRDFVAMELIVGESLAEWLRATRRSPAAILDAFRDAGRGLAAAHAAGIVHRDFKPHNVLRSRDGRIVVTDFGLAREAHGALSPALDATLPAGELGASSTASASSPLAGLTMTGALLGTPAYMAPEQWSGGAVTPATDQFAFCVALWEALAGQRPYPGPTLDDLRAQVGRGPAALDASRIPRRVRGLLRRGLDPDPARRWPSMDALLIRLIRVQRRSAMALVFPAIGLVGTAVLVLAQRGDDAPIALCDPPSHDLAAVWSPAIRADLAARLSDAHAAVLDTTVWSWRAARGAACTAPAAVRRDQLTCLDGVLARLDAVRQAFLQVPSAPAEEIQAQLIDPAICRKATAADVPRLTLVPTTPVIAAYALYARSQTEHKPAEAEIAQLIAASTTDPCGRVIATLAFEAASKSALSSRPFMTDAAAAADQCGDERLKADLLIRDIRFRIERPVVGAKGAAAIRHAQIAADRVAQPDVAARLAETTLWVALERRAWHELFRIADTAVAGYRARGLPIRMLNSVIARNLMHIIRSEPGDLETVAADVRAFRPLAIANHQPDLARQLEVDDAYARFRRGELAAADDLVRLWQAQPPGERSPRARRVTGEVVDATGRPVTGARIAASRNLLADPTRIGLPRLLNGDDGRDDDLRITTSDATGRFTIEDCVPDASIAAELGDRRSRPAAVGDHLKLVLAPTREIRGRVNLAGTPATRVYVEIDVGDELSGQIELAAPVAPDGSFAIAGAPQGELGIGAVLRGGDDGERFAPQPVPASSGPTSGVSLALTPPSRVLDVVVRSAIAAPLEGAQVFVLRGKPAIRSLADMLRAAHAGLHSRLARPVAGEDVPRAVIGKVRPGDLVAHVEHADPGELTVCALSFSGDLLDPDFWPRLRAHESELAVRCQPIAATTAVVELAAPPQPSFE
ncbi:MAG TPA: serine/threonine-protein kinase [Kofleriaceae bacterium]|nr:serine/threonine-protein kinase [Kofleriaceae bacterium]